SSDLLSFFYFITFLDRKFRQMQIEGEQSLAVVDHYAIAFKEQRPGQDDASAIDGSYRCSTGNAEIEALMRALHGTVEDAFDSKHVGDRGIHRRRKRTLPFAVRAQGFEGLVFGCLVLFDFLLLFGTGCGITRWNL